MFQEENWIVDKLVALRLPLKLFLFVLIYVNFSVIALLRRHLFCKKMFCMCFHLVVFSISFQKYAIFIPLMAMLSTWNTVLNMWNFFLLLVTRFYCCWKTKEIGNMLSTFSLSKRNGCISETMFFGPHVGKSKMRLRGWNFQLLVW